MFDRCVYGGDSTFIEKIESTPFGMKHCLHGTDTILRHEGTEIQTVHLHIEPILIRTHQIVAIDTDAAGTLCQLYLTAVHSSSDLQLGSDSHARRNSEAFVKSLVVKRQKA